MTLHPEKLDNLAILEFSAIVELLRPLLTGNLSLPALSQIAPRTDLAAVKWELAMVEEAQAYLRQGDRPLFGGLIDPRPTLEKLQVEGIVCPAVQIFGVVEIAKAVRDTRGLFVEPSYAKLNELAQGMADFRELVKSLDGKIMRDGSLDSSASPALGRIRQSIEHVRKELEAALEKVLHRLARDGVLQEEIITVRNGRYVVPVQSGKKRRVEGVVHGASSSGASLYVEPLETLPLNNELAELEDREMAEIQRILADFSNRLRERRQELIEATEILSHLDLAFAKAEFAGRHGGRIPEFTEKRDLVLREARHPLLDAALRASGRAPVPLTVELREPQTLMIISGPNTGGKTVALKTIGTAVLMAQAALPVLAEEARLPLFARVFADIGDQQSIAQNLSTFSAHIRNIQDMVASAGPHDLVLADEIGSSTDPQEGAALAIAILEYFRRRGAMAFISTHHSRLKAYAAETPEAVNAAMDFDEATLSPTYKLLSGLPGKSSGIDVAEWLGLDPVIIQQARTLLEPAAAETSSLIASLHVQRAKLESEQMRLGEQEKVREAEHAQALRKMLAERQAKLKELDRRLEETLRDHERRWKTALEELRKQAQAEGKSTKALAKARRQEEAFGRQAREEWNARVLEALDESPAEVVAARPAALGDRVRLVESSTPGVVTAVFEDDQLEVEVGRLRMRVRQNDLRVLSDSEVAHAPTMLAPSHLSANPSSKGPAAEQPEPETEINVIGSTAEEACELVDKFLDEAFLQGRFKLRVVHGHGKGILRKSLHEMFTVHPHVEKFYPAPQREGGSGATLVELKR
ncbi:MAG: endonuclease MutS2 [Terriglobia bacterium]